MYSVKWLLENRFTVHVWKANGVMYFLLFACGYLREL
jgi:hypothetical protein